MPILVSEQKGYTILIQRGKSQVIREWGRMIFQEGAANTQNTNKIHQTHCSYNETRMKYKCNIAYKFVRTNCIAMYLCH